MLGKLYLRSTVKVARAQLGGLYLQKLAAASSQTGMNGMLAQKRASDYYGRFDHLDMVNRRGTGGLTSLGGAPVLAFTHQPTSLTTGTSMHASGQPIVTGVRTTDRVGQSPGPKPRPASWTQTQAQPARTHTGASQAQTQAQTQAARSRQREERRAAANRQREERRAAANRQLDRNNTLAEMLRNNPGSWVDSHGNFYAGPGPGPSPSPNTDAQSTSRPDPFQVGAPAREIPPPPPPQWTAATTGGVRTVQWPDPLHSSANTNAWRPFVPGGSGYYIPNLGASE